jgi:membrane fusion protein
MSERVPLFRPEAIPLGDSGAPLGTRPLPWAMVGAILAATLLLALGFSFFTGVSRKETLGGYLQPSGGAVRVLAPRTGTLARVAAAPGARVEAGAPLFLIVTPRDLEGGGSLAVERTAALDRQILALRSRLAAEQSRAGLDTDEARARLAGLRSEAGSLAQQRATQMERIATTEERLKALAPVRARGFISEDEMRNREEYLQSLRQGLSGIERQLAENWRGQEEAAIAARGVPATLADRSGALRAELADLERQRTEAGAEGAQLVRAPVSGKDVALRAEPGRPVAAGTPILTIAPGNGALNAVLFASPSAVGLIRPGQRVRLMYDAFPVARFGAHSGVVTRVWTAALPADESDGPSRYRVDVALDRQSVTANGAEAPLQPDMTLKADVVLEKRSLLEWLLQPLLSARARR